MPGTAASLPVGGKFNASYLLFSGQKKLPLELPSWRELKMLRCRCHYPLMSPTHHCCLQSTVKESVGAFSPIFKATNHIDMRVLSCYWLIKPVSRNFHSCCKTAVLQNIQVFLKLTRPEKPSSCSNSQSKCCWRFISVARCGKRVEFHKKNRIWQLI